MESVTVLVRLKPFSKKKSCLLRRYTYRGIRFDCHRGWYRVTGEVADYLRSVRQIPGDEDSPLAFDVCTESEAKAIDQKEADASRQVTPAEKATTVVEAREDPLPPGRGDTASAEVRPSRSSSKGRKRAST